MTRMRLVPRRAAAVALSAAFFPGPVAGPRLQPDTERGWTRYVQVTEARRAREAGDPGRFLALDFTGTAARDRAAVTKGAVVVRPERSLDGSGRQVPVPDAMVHHWRGAIFIPGSTAATVMQVLRAGPPRQADVLRSRVLEAGPDAMRVYLRIQRTKLLTVVYDTEHVVTFSPVSSSRAESTTRATRIVEVADAGTARERALGPGEDHAFLWRLNGYWRYVDVPGGVIAECESISLSRAVPFGLGLVAGPLIEGAARESLESALRAVRDAASGKRV